MSSESLVQYRQQLLAEVSGEILEIGFGTGLNLAYYPESVQKITAIDPNLGVKKLAQARIERSAITVDNRLLSGENIPIADASFDSIVSTWTLCSIANIESAISEIYRLLKPGGKFLFIEHGISPESQVRVWQNRLTPIQKLIADGCHLNRNIKKIVSAKFQVVTTEQFYAPKLPKILGYMYRGKAIKY